MSGADAASSLSPLLSLEQWAELAEDEPGEFVDGRLVDEEMPNVIHELIVGWLLATLRAWAVPRGGLVLGSETKLAVAPRRGRKPDVAVYLPGSRKPSGRPRGAPAGCRGVRGCCSISTAFGPRWRPSMTRPSAA